jgi:hypothetical protein
MTAMRRPRRPEYAPMPAPSLPAPIDARAMAAALARLLDRVRGSREVLPHLAALEGTLKTKGLAALGDASLPVLQRIGSQFASLAADAGDPALAALQATLLAELEARIQPTRPRYLSTFVDSAKLEVSEASVSDFMAAARGEQPTEPAGLTQDR